KCKQNEAIHFSLILCVNDQIGIKTSLGIFNRARNESADFHRKISGNFIRQTLNSRFPVEKSFPAYFNATAKRTYQTHAGYNNSTHWIIPLLFLSLSASRDL